MKSPKKIHEATPPTIAARGNGSARPLAMALAPAVPPAPAPRSEWTPHHQFLLYQEKYES